MESVTEQDEVKREGGREEEGAREKQGRRGKRPPEAVAQMKEMEGDVKDQYVSLSPSRNTRHHKVTN